jgi:hypothetical protein
MFEERKTLDEMVERLATERSVRISRSAFRARGFAAAAGRSKKTAARLRGRARRGERCPAGVPHGHWKTTTFTGALRLTGMTAPFVYDSGTNGNIFLAYVEQVPVRH